MVLSLFLVILVFPLLLDGFAYMCPSRPAASHVANQPAVCLGLAGLSVAAWVKTGQNHWKNQKNKKIKNNKTIVWQNSCGAAQPAPEVLPDYGFIAFFGYFGFSDTF